MTPETADEWHNAPDSYWYHPAAGHEWPKGRSRSEVDVLDADSGWMDDHGVLRGAARHAYGWGGPEQRVRAGQYLRRLRRRNHARTRRSGWT
jgi:hypothetical protein